MKKGEAQTYQSCTCKIKVEFFTENIKSRKYPVRDFNSFKLYWRKLGINKNIFQRAERNMFL